jgi:hypothetical protein
MNKHYDNALAAMRELDARGQATEASALAAMQTRAILAVAEEQAKTNQHLELANLITYAQLCKASRDGHASMQALKAVQKAMGLPDDSDDDDEDLDL